MEISDQLRCLFSARVEQHGDRYHVEIPSQELDVGELRQGETYRVALLSAPTADDADEQPTRSRRSPPSGSAESEPPVTEGERRDVEIENLGDQGDGITRVDHGFVVIVPDTEQGERVTIEITDVRRNVAFAEVVERLSYYD
jgi:predicted RNA-binding protein with TRAM domain